MSRMPGRLPSQNTGPCPGHGKPPARLPSGARMGVHPPHDLSVLSIPKIALLSFPANPTFAFRHPHPPAAVSKTLQRPRLTHRVHGRPHQRSADETGAPPGDGSMPRCRIPLK
jgi:hypothetical protein